MDGFVAIADGTRRRIIEMLSVGERSFGDIAEEFAMSRPAVSQHLKVLRDSGIVSVRRDAQRRIYRLRGEGLVEVDRWLDGVQTFWSDRLDELEEALREPPETGEKS